jgi:hypothetical protein
MRAIEPARHSDRRVLFSLGTRCPARKALSPCSDMADSLAHLIGKVAAIQVDPAVPARVGEPWPSTAAHGGYRATSRGEERGRRVEPALQLLGFAAGPFS